MTCLEDRACRRIIADPACPDQLSEHLEVSPWEVPGLLQRLAEVPDPRDPRGVRHALTIVLALTACAVLAGPPLCWRSASGSQTPRPLCSNSSVR